MGNKDSKSSSDHAATPNLDSVHGIENPEVIGLPDPDCGIEASEDLSNLGNSSDQDQLPTSSSVQPQPSVTPSKKPRKEANKLTTSYHEYLEHGVKFDHDKFSKCSAADISACLRILLEYFYENFRKIHICQEEVYSIYKSTRHTYKTKKAFAAAFEEVLQQEQAKIAQNSNWGEIVMFGALLCKLLGIYQGDAFLITKQLNIWIMELIKSAVESNENGLIAFMLILRRVLVNIHPTKEDYDKYMGVLEILLRDENTESKTQAIYDHFEEYRHSMIEDYETIEEINYKERVDNSMKCREFEKFLNSEDENASFDINLFTDITEIEVDFYSRKLIEAGIEKPQRIKYLSHTAYRFQQILSNIRRITCNVVNNLEEEIEVMKQNGIKSTHLVKNLAEFIGELHMYNRGMISPLMMTNWLTLLSELGESVLIATTLKLCGYMYKCEEPKHFEKFVESIGIFGSLVTDEVDMVAGKDDNEDINVYLKYQKSRRFQPTEGARMIDDFGLFLSEISKDKNVDYNYQNLHELKNYELIMAANYFIKEISSPTANVIKLAEFLKSFFETSFLIGRFIMRMKANFELKMSEIPADNHEQIISIGKLIGEMRNYSITDKIPQDKWLEMIEILDPLENCKILEIQLEVLKVMLQNIYIFEEDKYFEYSKCVKDIDPSNPKYSPQIKSKILQITQNLVSKKFDKASKDVLFRVKFGLKIDGLPLDIPQTHPEDFDLNDFVKIFFISATTNQFLMENYLSSMRFFANGPEGKTFVRLLRDLSVERFESLLDPELFDEDDAIGTLTFILCLYPRSFMREKNLTSFLQNILKFDNFDIHKNCFKILLKLIKNGSSFAIFKKCGEFSKESFDLLRKVQVKLNGIENPSVEEQEEEIEIWHIVDFQGSTNDQSLFTSESIEPSQLAWSFTKSYQDAKNECEEKQKADSFAQNSAQSAQKTMTDQREQKSAQVQLNPTERRKTRKIEDKKTKQIEWNVTRDDLKGRNDLQHEDLPKLRKHFDRNSPLYVVTGYLEHSSPQNDQMAQNLDQTEKKLNKSEDSIQKTDKSEILGQKSDQKALQTDSVAQSLTKSDENLKTCQLSTQKNLLKQEHDASDLRAQKVNEENQMVKGSTKIEIQSIQNEKKTTNNLNLDKNKQNDDFIQNISQSDQRSDTLAQVDGRSVHNLDTASDSDIITSKKDVVQKSDDITSKPGKTSSLSNITSKESTSASKCDETAKLDNITSMSANITSKPDNIDQKPGITSKSDNITSKNHEVQKSTGTVPKNKNSRPATQTSPNLSQSNSENSSKIDPKSGTKDKTNQKPDSSALKSQNVTDNFSKLSAQSVSADLLDTFNEVMPMISTNTSSFKSCAILIHGWAINNPTMRSAIKELITLLSTELKKNHKLLLTDMSNELTQECDELHRKKGDGHVQQKNLFLTTVKAVVPFLEKHSFYNMLDMILLGHIKNGNQLALGLFLDLTEGMKDFLAEECKERDIFITSCVSILEKAANFKGEETRKRTTEMLKFFEGQKFNALNTWRDNVANSGVQSEFGGSVQSVHSSNGSSQGSNRKRRQRRYRRHKNASPTTEVTPNVNQSTPDSQDSNKTTPTSAKNNQSNEETTPLAKTTTNLTPNNHPMEKSNTINQNLSQNNQVYQTTTQVNRNLVQNLQVIPNVGQSNQMGQNWVQNSPTIPNWAQGIIAAQIWAQNSQVRQNLAQNSQTAQNWVQNSQVAQQWAQNSQVRQNLVQNSQTAQNWVQNSQVTQQWAQNIQTWHSWNQNNQMAQIWAQNTQMRPSLIQNNQMTQNWTQNSQMWKNWVQSNQTVQNSNHILYNLTSRDPQNSRTVETALKSDNITSKLENIPQTSGAASKSDNITSKADNITSKSSAPPTSNNITSKPENITSKSGAALKSDNITSKNPEAPSMSKISQQSVQNSQSAQKLGSSSQQTQNVTKNFHKLSAQSTPADLIKTFNEVMPMISTNASSFKNCAILIHDWANENPAMRPAIKKLIILVSKELKKRYKQLLVDMSYKLREECDELRRKKGLEQQKSSFVTTVKAVVPFLEKHSFYKMLEDLLGQISFGNQIALDLFLDLTEGMKEFLGEDCSERDKFIPYCARILAKAVNFKGEQETQKRTLEIFKFFEGQKNSISKTWRDVVSSGVRRADSTQSLQSFNRSSQRNQRRNSQQIGSNQGIALNKTSKAINITSKSDAVSKSGNITSKNQEVQKSTESVPKNKNPNTSTQHFKNPNKTSAPFALEPNQLVQNLIQLQQKGQWENIYGPNLTQMKQDSTQNMQMEQKSEINKNINQSEQKSTIGEPRGIKSFANVHNLDTHLKSDIIATKMSDITSKSDTKMSDITSKSDTKTISVNKITKPEDINVKQINITSKPNLVSKAGNITSKSSNITSNFVPNQGAPISSPTIQGSGKSGQSNQASGSNTTSKQTSTAKTEPTKAAYGSNISVTKAKSSMADPTDFLNTDDKINFYINQLNSSNIAAIGNKISPLMTKEFSRRKSLEALLQKGISDQEFINPVIELFQFLFKKNEFKNSKSIMANVVYKEFICLCEDENNVAQKMFNLANFTIKFEPYIKNSLIFILWRELLKYVEIDTPHALRVLVLMMSNKLELFYETPGRKQYVKDFLMVFKEKLRLNKGTNSKDQLEKIIESLESGKIKAECSKATKSENRELKPRSEKVEATKQQNTASAQSNNLPAEKPRTESQIRTNIDSPTILEFRAKSLHISSQNTSSLSSSTQQSSSSSSESQETSNNDKNKQAELIKGITNQLNSIELEDESSESEQLSSSDNQEQSSLDLRTFEDNPNTNPSNPTNSDIGECKEQSQSEESTTVDESDKKSTASRPHPDDVIRPLIFTSDYILFDDSVENAQKFENILKVLSSNSIYEKNSIRIKENIAIAIIKLNYLKTRAEVEDFEKFSDSFFKYYTHPNQTSIVRFILLKFLKAWKFYEEKVESSDKVDANVYDRYSKSICRIKKSFKISCDVDMDEKITSKLDKITSEPEKITPEIGTTSLTGTVPKSSNITSNTNTARKSASTPYFSNFIGKLQNLLINILLDTIKATNSDEKLIGKPETCQLVCDLYLQEIISSEFIINSIKKLNKNNFENLIYLSEIVKNVGALLKIREKEKFEAIFFNILYINQENPKVVSEISELRRNCWANVENFTPIFLLFHENPGKFFGFIETLWRRLMENPEKVAELSEIVEELLENLGDNFAFLISEFMENRRISFGKIPLEMYSKMVSQRLKGSILFVFELFEMQVVNSERFAGWFKEEVFGKLGDEEKGEISTKLKKRGMDVDENLAENLNEKYEKLNNF